MGIEQMSSSIKTTLTESNTKDDGEEPRIENDSTQVEKIAKDDTTEECEGVVTVVEKTRKAAISLWTILHAQVGHLFH
jgi:hypothetical protein